VKEGIERIRSLEVTVRLRTVREVCFLRSPVRAHWRALGAWPL